MLESVKKVLTIGHSTMSLEKFLGLLKSASVTAVADVRTSPFSRRMPHFSRDAFRASLKGSGIRYVFLGNELGGRPRSSNLYYNGVADYSKMALEPDFFSGINRVIDGSKKHSIVLMCSEHNPLDCHRCLLVGRALFERNIALGHILSSGRIADHTEIEEKLLSLDKKDTGDMFVSRENRLDIAYKARAKNVAFKEAHSETQPTKIPNWYNDVK